jgi:hypothetical protein
MLSNTWNTIQRQAITCLEAISPTLKRINSENRAIRIFGSEWSDRDDTAIQGVFKRAVRKNLTNAGYDVDTDEPYIKVLNLKGGKSEFDQRYPSCN